MSGDKTIMGQTGTYSPKGPETRHEPVTSVDSVTAPAPGIPHARAHDEEYTEDAERYDDQARLRMSADGAFRDRVLIAVEGVRRVFSPGLVPVGAIALALHLSDQMTGDPEFAASAVQYLRSRTGA